MRFDLLFVSAGPSDISGGTKILRNPVTADPSGSAGSFSPFPRLHEMASKHRIIMSPERLRLSQALTVCEYCMAATSLSHMMLR
jgi:hypothetical protein